MSRQWSAMESTEIQTWACRPWFAEGLSPSNGKKNSWGLESNRLGGSRSLTGILNLRLNLQGPTVCTQGKSEPVCRGTKGRHCEYKAGRARTGHELKAGEGNKGRRAWTRDHGSGEWSYDGSCFAEGQLRTSLRSWWLSDLSLNVCCRAALGP